MFDPWLGKISWRRKRAPHSIILAWGTHGQRSLVGYSPWDHKESDLTQWLKQQVIDLASYSTRRDIRVTFRWEKQHVLIGRKRFGTIFRKYLSPKNTCKCHWCLSITVEHKHFLFLILTPQKPTPNCGMNWWWQITGRSLRIKMGTRNTWSLGDCGLRIVTV